MKILYMLSNEIGLILSIVSLLFAIIIWFFPNLSNGKKCGIASICIFILLLLGGNYLFMQDYVSVPYVEGLEFFSAEHKLNESYLYAVPVSEQTFSRNDYVKMQSIEYGSIVKKGETIVLILSPTQGRDTTTIPHTEDEITTNKTIAPSTNARKTTIQNVTTTKENTIEIGSVINSENTQNSFTEGTENNSEKTTASENSVTVTQNYDLEIIVDNYKIFFDGYDEPDNPHNWGIEYDKGISGKFHYSRELTEEESSNWFQGGKLLDADGNKIGEEGNYPIIWSSKEGYFAMQFPEGLEPGDYTFVIFHLINSHSIYYYLDFTI
ncbi:MAG: PASTA domain-containing protein [Eubacterium sp.]|nr:PASTA domain-containing protein [Eubacterium sp.]